MKVYKYLISTSERILKIAGFIYFFLTAMSFIDLKFYYLHFGIAINEYISISEILFLAMDRIGIILIVLIFQILGWSFFVNGIYDKNARVKYTNKHPDLPANWFYFNTFLLSKKSIFLIAANFCLTIIGFSLKFLFSTNNFILLISDVLFLNYWMHSCILLLLIFPFQEIWFTENKNTLKSRLNLAIIILIIILILSIWIKNAFVYRRIAKNRIQDKIELHLPAGIITAPTRTTSYIGQTEKFFFFWNRVTSEATIYSKSNVNKIVLKK